MMTTFIGALLIGLTLGLLGSGGSAITVPILVYLIGHDAKVSIAESMAIVGVIALAGAIPKLVTKQIDWRSVTWFGIPAMLGTYCGASLGGLASNTLQLTVFGSVVILAAGFMLKNALSKSAEIENNAPARQTSTHLLGYAKIICEGILVGTLTGFVGVGGGFLIVPALIMLEKLPIRRAISTSLMIISLNSVVGFGKYYLILAAQGQTVSLPTIVTFAIIGIGGCAIGQKLNSKIDQRSLKIVFALFLLIIGSFIIFRENA